MDTRLYIGLVMVMVACVGCFLVIAIRMHNSYQKKINIIENQYEALHKYVHDIVDEINLENNLFRDCLHDIGELIKKESKEIKEDELEEPDDIRIMESEEYLFSDRKKMHLWYNKKDDKLWCTSKDTNFVPCVIAHPSKIIGDGLSFFGFQSNDDRTVYVRNNKLEIDFMIELEMPTIYTRENAVIIDKLDEEEEPVKDNECRIKNVDGHYEVYINGEFCCSADTMTEAAVELEKALAEEGKNA